MVKDKELLKIYMLGFNDELYTKPKAIYSNQLKQSAYDHGRVDAIIGDDISSSDLQSNDEILTRIKSIVK